MLLQLQEVFLISEDLEGEKMFRKEEERSVKEEESLKEVEEIRRWEERKVWVWFVLPHLLVFILELDAYIRWRLSTVLHIELWDVVDEWVGVKHG